MHTTWISHVHLMGITCTLPMWYTFSKSSTGGVWILNGTAHYSVTWISHAHHMDIICTPHGYHMHTPHVVHFFKIFHRGCMDFKWSSPNHFQWISYRFKVKKCQTWCHFVFLFFLVWGLKLRFFWVLPMICQVDVSPGLSCDLSMKLNTLEKQSLSFEKSRWA